MPDFRDFDFLEQEYGVSRESYEALDVYYQLLLKWQRAINLVSRLTLDEAWLRHFIDSLQLLPHLKPHHKTIVDLGCGAGFPGAALSIVRPWLSFVCVDSDTRKIEFLRAVSRETSASFEAIAGRVEVVLPQLSPDLIVSRAFASLIQILDFSSNALKNIEEIDFLLLKGASFQEELSVARAVYDFECDAYDSVTGDGAKILYIRSVNKR